MKLVFLIVVFCITGCAVTQPVIQMPQTIDAQAHNCVAQMPIGITGTWFRIVELVPNPNQGSNEQFTLQNFSNQRLTFREIRIIDKANNIIRIPYDGGSTYDPCERKTMLKGNTLQLWNNEGDTLRLYIDNVLQQTLGYPKADRGETIKFP